MSEPPRHLRLALALAAGAMAVHAAVVCYILPPSFTLDDTPVLFADYTVHLRSCLVYLSLRDRGAQWGVDPLQMAGYPANLAESASNRAAEVFVEALGARHPVAAFKVWLFLSFLAVPLLVAAAAAVLRFRPGEIAAATWVTSLIWCVDPTFRLFREFGGTGFPLASAGCLLAAALAYDFLARGGWTRAAAVVAATVVVTWIHAMSPLILGIAIVAAIALRPPSATRARALALPVLLFAGVAPAAVWIVPLVDNWRWLTTTAYRLGGFTPAEIGAALLLAPGARVEGALLWMAAGGCAVLWRRRPDPGRWLVAPAVVWMLIAAAPIAALRTFQPRRFMITGLLWLVPAIVVAGGAVIGRLRPRLRVLVLAAVAATGVAYQLLPWLQVATAAPQRMASLRDRARVPDDVTRLLAWVATKPTDGRIILEDMDHIANEAYGGTFVGAMIPLWFGTPVLGGPSEQPFQQQAVDMCYGRWLGHELTSLDGATLAGLLDRYAVHWVVAVNPETDLYLARQSSVVVPADRWGRFATYAVRSPAPLATGARSVRLEIGRVSVRGAASRVTTIAVHWHQRARTDPALPLERIVYPDDPVGLIRVENGTVADFDVVFD